MTTAERTDYASLWTPRSLEEAMYQIDTSRCNDRDEFFAEGERIAERLSQYVPEHCNTVVEFGCGIGRILVHVPGQYRVGIDVSAEMLAYARDLFPDVHFQTQYTVSSLLWPYEPQADFLYSWLVLQHMDFDDAIEAICAMVNALRPGGVAALLFAGYGGPWSKPGVVPEYEAEQVFDPENDRYGCPGHRMVAWQRAHVDQIGTELFQSYEVIPIAGMSDREEAWLRERNAEAFENPDWSPYYLLVGTKAAL